MFLMLDKLIDLWGILKNVQFAGEKTPAKANTTYIIHMFAKEEYAL